MILRNVKGLLRQVTRRQLSVTPKVENFSCCPPGSWGRSSGNEEYIDQGKVVDLNGLEQGCKFGREFLGSVGIVLKGN